MRSMFSFLFSLKGNDKACVWPEPLTSIPFHLYIPFMTLYMFYLGVDDIQIGIILSVGLVFQVLMAILGGVLTDKFGRRRTTFVSDVIAWSIPLLIWTFSQNFWWFFIAAIINSAQNISAISWESLWADDTKDEEKTDKIIGWLYIISLVSTFFAPIVGFLVMRNSLVPVMRILFFLSFLSMTARFVLTYLFSTETKRGESRMEETKNDSIIQMIVQYKDVFRQILQSHAMRRITILLALVGITQVISSTFFALYVTQNLGISESFLAYFPVLRAGMMILFFLLLQHHLSHFKRKNIMLFGVLLYVLSHGFLLASPDENLIWLSIYIVMEASAGALFLPRLDTQAVHAVKPKERARIYGSFDVIAFALAAPFGILAGYLSDLDRRLPFALNILLFVLMIYFVMSKHEPHYAE